MVTRVWEKSRQNFVSGCRFPKAEDILHHLQFSIILFQIEPSTSTCLWERKIISLFFAPWFTYLNYYNSCSTYKKVNEGCFARKHRLTLTTDVLQKYPTCNVPSNPISAMFLCSEWTWNISASFQNWTVELDQVKLRLTKTSRGKSEENPAFLFIKSLFKFVKIWSLV